MARMALNNQGYRIQHAEPLDQGGEVEACTFLHTYMRTRRRKSKLIKEYIMHACSPSSLSSKEQKQGIVTTSSPTTAEQGVETAERFLYSTPH